MEMSAVHSEQEIDILWRQDIDLGVEREVFDVHFQEREADARRVREQAEEKRKRERDLENILLTLCKLDKETGEVLPCCLSQNPQGADDTISCNPCIELMAEPLLSELTPPQSLVSSGNSHSTPSSQGSPITQNPLLSALLFSKDLPAEEEKASIELLPLPDLQDYMDLLEAHVPERPCELLANIMDSYSQQLSESQGKNMEVTDSHLLAYTHSGPAEIMQTHIYTDSDTSEVTQPLECVLPEATEHKQTFCNPEDLTESFLDRIMNVCPSANLNQMSLQEHEQSSNVHTRTESYPEHTNTTPPEHSQCQRELIQRKSPQVTDDMTLFSLESTRESVDLDMSLYGDDIISTSQSEAEHTSCVQLDPTELFDLSLLSEAVDLQPKLFPSNTESSPTQLTQDDSHKPISDKSDPDEPVIHTGALCETISASQPQKSHRSCSMFRDEQRARTLSLPLSVDDIINMSVDAFNEAISTYELGEAQLSLMRDIRRRGKNKMAAQSCRKRKLDSLVDLEAEVEALQEENEQGLREREKNAKALRKTREKLSKLYAEVFSKLRDEHGNPYSPKEYKLQYSTDGRFFLLPCTPHNNKSS
ncbi:nuclear factor erythroid 2-related factor 2b isoform X2 [Hoplias malabaricus]|uniref:nuclear factor erythroid 2-related factor 2b isoform X2 n=1 Tax=Hoplias malabaricus TaxID=27720 RepID=UPI003461EE19